MLPGAFSGLGALAHFLHWSIFRLGSISIFWSISSLCVLICFKYFLIYVLRLNVSQSNQKNSELNQIFMHNFLCQNDKIFIKIFKLWQVFVYNFLFQNVPTNFKLCTADALKALLSKNRFYFFFSSSDMQKFQHLLGCYATSINSSFKSFFKHFISIIA